MNPSEQQAADFVLLLQNSSCLELCEALTTCLKAQSSTGMELDLLKLHTLRMMAQVFASTASELVMQEVFLQVANTANRYSLTPKPTTESTSSPSN